MVIEGKAKNHLAVILKNNNLHIEIIITQEHLVLLMILRVLVMLLLKSAISTICDNEDSVAAVDAEDKVVCYRNWLGLNEGYLKTTFVKMVKISNVN